MNEMGMDNLLIRINVIGEKKGSLHSQGLSSKHLRGILQNRGIHVYEFL